MVVFQTEESAPADAKNPQTVLACTEALRSLDELCRSLKVAVFATDDGFEVTRFPASTADDQRLTSMASSLQALTEAVAHDRTIGQTDYTLIESADGRVLLRRVPGHPLVLLAVFGNEEVAGQAISSSRSVLLNLQEALPASL